MGVVELLEVVHVHHRDAVRAGGTLQGFVEGAPPRQSCQLIAECHVEGFLQGRAQHQQQCGHAQRRQQRRLQEDARQHPPQAQQRQQHRRVQGARPPPGLPAQRSGRRKEQQGRQLRQRVPVARNPGEVPVRQQVMHALGLLRGQQDEDRQQGAAADSAQQQVLAAPATLGPQRMHGKQQWQPGGYRMEAQRRQRTDVAQPQVVGEVGMQHREQGRHQQQQAQRAHLVVHQRQPRAQAGQQPGQHALAGAADILVAQGGPQHQCDQQGGQHEQVMRRLAERVIGQAVIPVRSLHGRSTAVSGVGAGFLNGHDVNAPAPCDDIALTRGSRSWAHGQRNPRRRCPAA